MELQLVVKELLSVRSLSPLTKTCNSNNSVKSDSADRESSHTAVLTASCVGLWLESASSHRRLPGGPGPPPCLCRCHRRYSKGERSPVLARSLVVDESLLRWFRVRFRSQTVAPMAVPAKPDLSLT